MESWRNIPGFPGYQASDQGRIRSKDRSVLKFNPKVGKEIPHQRKGLLLKMHKHRGYPRLNLCINGTPQKEYAHRLVLLAFVGEAPPNTEARHLNGKPADIRLKNLQWGTKVENAADRKPHGTNGEGEKHGMAKLRASDVARIKAIPLPWPHGTIVRLARELSVSIYAIWRIKAGIGWRSAATPSVSTIR
jgi:hypothetical protein